MQNEILDFLIRHWILASGFGAALVFAFVVELNNIMSKAEVIGNAELIIHMNRGDGIVVDIRSAAAYNKGHILGSKNISVDSLLSDKNLQKKYAAKKLILVCDRGVAAKNARKILQKVGYNQVVSLQNGLSGWHNGGMPLSI